MNDLPELTGPLGSRLRQAREAQGLDVQFVSERLKFSVRQVEALESGDYEAMPHRTQVRGFVRAYARLLQLPDAELLAMVDAEMPPEAPVPERPQLKGAVLQTRGRRRWPWLVTGLLVVMLVSAGGGWLLYDWLRGSHLTSPPAPENQLLMETDLALPLASDAAASTVAPVASGPVAASAAVTASASAHAPSRPAAASAAVAAPAVAAKGRLQLAFAAPAWVEIYDAQGRSRYRALGKPGENVALDGPAPFRITIGKADAVRVLFAGRPVDLQPHTRGEVARLTLPAVR